MLKVSMYCIPADPVDEVAAPFAIEVRECAPGVYAMIIDGEVTVPLRFTPEQNVWLKVLIERAYAGPGALAFALPPSVAM